jgi:hypothetical protein
MYPQNKGGDFTKSVIIHRTAPIYQWHIKTFYIFVKKKYKIYEKNCLKCYSYNSLGANGMH